MSQSFSYYGPGQLLSGTGFRGQGGRVGLHGLFADPLPARRRAGLCQFADVTSAATARRRRIGRCAELLRYPWRDNFCERRGFPVGQCPAGIGHQGQDIRPAPCKPRARHRTAATRRGDVVAVRDGVILRSPRQEAAYLFVNSANEHIRFRYLHMNPRKMDEDNLLSGRRVHEGEVIGEVSNFSKKEGGTSYHLHFDVQVPTKDGWVFVNPYMTLVAAYERLIGERGTELADPSVVASGRPDRDRIGGRQPTTPRVEPHAAARSAKCGQAQPQARQKCAANANRQARSVSCDADAWFARRNRGS